MKMKEAGARVVLGGFGLVFIYILAVCLSGCAPLPKLSRCQDLLHQARVANRDCHRILKEYERLDCRSHPEQLIGALDFGEVGY